MENYIGARLRFETAGGDVEGRLKEIRKQERVLVIEEDENKLKEVPVEDIKKLEIVKTVQKTAEPTQRDCVSEEEARKILEDAFLHAYPTEDAFLAITSGGLLKIIANVFKCRFEDRIAVLVLGDDVFARLGYVFAMTLHNANLNPDVESTSHASPKTVSMRQRFTNSGHKLTKASGAYKLVVVCSDVDDVALPKQLTAQNILFCTLPSKCDEGGAKHGVVYGVKTERVAVFPGKVFCIDVGLGDALLRKYNLRRRYPSSVFGIQK
eukprot:jgi/Antlo1/204/799